MKALWLFLALALAGCASGIGRPVNEIKATSDVHGVQHVTVTAHAFYFDPNRVIVQANMPVELKVKNHSMFVPHNFSVNASDAGIVVDEGLGMFWDGETAKFTATEPGEYRFYCKVGGHSKKGMTGTIVVVR